MKRLAIFCSLLIAACGGSEAPKLEPRDGAEKETPRAEEREAVPSSGKVAITQIEERAGDEYTITLNGVLVIHGVTLKETRSGTKYIGFPEEAGRDGGRGWAYVRVERGDADALTEQLASGKTEDEPKGFEITSATAKVLANPSSKTKAFIQFELEGGAVKLSSWRLVEGSKGLFLASPSERVGEKYEDVLYSPDEDFRKALEEAALKAYEEAKGAAE